MSWLSKRLRLGRPAGSGGQGHDWVVDWACDPIAPSGWAKHATPPPDSVAVVDAAIRASGVPASDIDRAAAVAGVWGLVVDRARPMLAVDPEAVRALDLVATRADLNDALLWNLFTHQGARGIAARNHLIESVFDSGQGVEVLAGLIRGGSYRAST